MTITSEQLVAWIGGFIWPFLRIVALFAIAPIFSAQMLPVRVRVGLALAVTAVAAPLLPPAPALDPMSGEGLLISASQILIGLALGFMIRMVFGAIETGGNLIGQTMGLGFAQMMDPANGVAVPVMSQFYTLLATLAFLGLNGHLVLIQVLVDSFTAIPIAPRALSQNGLWVLLSWAGWIFKGAIAIALPVVAALLLVNVAFGVMTRAAPQLNIFAVGFPISLMLGFVFILFTLPIFLPRFGELLDNAFGAVAAVTGG